MRRFFTTSLKECKAARPEGPDSISHWLFQALVSHFCSGQPNKKMKTFDASQATFVQVFTHRKEEEIVITTSCGCAVLELLEDLQSNIDGRECKDLHM